MNYGSILHPSRYPTDPKKEIYFSLFLAIPGRDNGFHSTNGPHSATIRDIERDKEVVRKLHLKFYSKSKAPAFIVGLLMFQKYVTQRKNSFKNFQLKATTDCESINAY